VVVPPENPWLIALFERPLPGSFRRAILAWSDHQPELQEDTVTKRPRRPPLSTDGTKGNPALGRQIPPSNTSIFGFLLCRVERAVPLLICRCPFSRRDVLPTRVVLEPAPQHLVSHVMRFKNPRCASLNVRITIPIR